MPRVHFLLPDGGERAVEAPVGWSLMQSAREANVPGIVAECGGQALCSTCHVYVDPEWLDKIGPPNTLEMITLDLAPDPTEASRLSCQITIGPDYEGLRVRVPPEQA